MPETTHDLDLARYIRTVPDFPKPGVQFRDITTLLAHADAFRASVERLAAPFRARPIGTIAAIESRGFIVGAALAHELRTGFVPIRKQGKLPAARFGEDYELEYGAGRLELHRDSVTPGQSVLLVDDLIATGGTAEAALKLLATAGAAIAGCAFVIELPDLGGRERLERLGHRVLALCRFAGH
jgi:adenine phosphoribosyltransferase